jgi:hypothetical protein
MLGMRAIRPAQVQQINIQILKHRIVPKEAGATDGDDDHKVLLSFAPLRTSFGSASLATNASGGIE